MLECCPHRDARRVFTAERRSGICDRFLVGLVVFTLVHAGEALAGDQASAAAAGGKPEQRDLRQSTSVSSPAFFSSSLFAVPETYSLPGVAESKAYSPKDFRPRGHSMFEPDARLNATDDGLINDTTVWQRLAEYRTRDRIRVLTLWESGVSSVSLQAGKRGDPSLQWTSRLTRGGAAFHGLLDRLFPVSALGDSNGAHAAAHAATPQPTAKGSTSVGALRFGPPTSP